MKNYKVIKGRIGVASLLEQADMLYPEGWDLVSITRDPVASVYFTGIFRKARKR